MVRYQGSGGGSWLGLGQPLATAMCQFYTTIYLKSDPHMDGDSDSRSRSCRERETERESERGKELERERVRDRGGGKGAVAETDSGCTN